MRTLLAAALVASVSAPALAQEEAPLFTLVPIEEAVATVQNQIADARIVEAELQENNWSWLWGEEARGWVWEIEVLTPDREEHEVIVDATTGNIVNTERPADKHSL